MKHLSRLDIEAIAEKYITAYMELPEVQDMQIYRIEPELFLERVLGLKIDYAHLSYDGSLLGMTSFVEVMVDVMTADFEEEHKLFYRKHDDGKSEQGRALKASCKPSKQQHHRNLGNGHECKHVAHILAAAAYVSDKLDHKVSDYAVGEEKRCRSEQKQHEALVFPCKLGKCAGLCAACLLKSAGRCAMRTLAGNKQQCDKPEQCREYDE